MCELGLTLVLVLFGCFVGSCVPCDLCLSAVSGLLEPLLIGLWVGLHVSGCLFWN